MTDRWPTRIRDDDYFGGGILKLTDWPDLDPHEKICATTFEEGLENTFEHNPPHLDICPNKDRNDVELTFVLNAGQDDGGPIWQFSLRRAIADYARQDCGQTESIDALLKALWRALTYTRMIKEKITSENYETLWRELDKEFPQQPDTTPPWLREKMQEWTEEFVRDIEQIFRKALLDSENRGDPQC